MQLRSQSAQKSDFVAPYSGERGAFWVLCGLSGSGPIADHSSPDEQHFPSRVGARINCYAGFPQKVTSLILVCVTLFREIFSLLF